MTKPTLFSLTLLLAGIPCAPGQEAPYDQAPSVAPPYHRIRYEGSPEAGALRFAVQYTLWIPPGIGTIRGVVVHQHGCGVGSCMSGQTGAFDLHWQALARKHDCALLSPSYEQPKEADCQLWCDPRNGSAATFQQALTDLASQTAHPELAHAPWALWGHSGGGHWAGGMVLLHPDRVVAAWLRSGVPLLEANPERPDIKPHQVPPAALTVPLLCNPGTKEGVTVRTGRFARVWPANERFFHHLRSRGALIGVAVDPLTSHECGNQRYLAIPWLDACLEARLTDAPGQALRKLPVGDTQLAPLLGTKAVPAATYPGDPKTASWLPNQEIARRWEHYVRDTHIPDSTPPPAPTALEVHGAQLRWQAEADPESGLAHFLIERDGTVILSPYAEQPPGFLLFPPEIRSLPSPSSHENV